MRWWLSLWTHAARRDGQYEMRYSVRDTGIGIDPEKAAALFDAFSQADASTTRKFGGTGLGLAISKQLVDRMGGDLKATGTPGEGATFEFTVPLPVDGQDVSPAVEADPVLEGLRVAALVRTRRPLGQSGRARERARRDPAAGRPRGPGGSERGIGRRPHGRSRGGRGRGHAHGHTQAERLDVPVVVLSRLAERCQLPDEKVHCLGKPVKASTFARALHKVATGTPSGDTKLVETVVEAVETSVATQMQVLLAEDDPVSQKVIGRMLDQLGYEYVAVSDGQEALDVLATAVFDVVLMDARMPVLDGLEATRQIRARADLEHPYIVAMTAAATDESRDVALEAGMDEFLGKPVTRDGLHDVLTRVASGQAVHR